MTFEQSEAASGLDVPEPQGGVPVSGARKRPPKIRAQVYTTHKAPVAFERPQVLARINLPQSQSVVPRAKQSVPTVGAQLQSPGTDAVITECKQATASLHIPQSHGIALSTGERTRSVRCKRAVINLIRLDFELDAIFCKIIARACFHHYLLAKVAAQIDKVIVASIASR
jgi:hypothetical protein